MGKSYRIDMTSGKCAKCGRETIIAPNGLCLSCVKDNIAALSPEEIKRLIAQETN